LEGQVSIIIISLILCFLFVQVVRESSNSSTTSLEPIEIPPPRPKRKPMHPYPRKVMPPPRKESPVEQRGRSTSPHSSLSEQENQSPNSVLSAVVSDTVGSADSATPNGSPSPCSANFIDQAELLPFEGGPPHDDVHRSKAAPEDLVSVVLILTLLLLNLSLNECSDDQL